MDSNSLNQLYHKRFEQKQQGQFVEAIHTQLQILDAEQQSGRIIDTCNAWNMLSHLYQLNQQLIEAEEAARQALATYQGDSNAKLETLATYEMKLATILADQGKCIEAVQFGKLALQHFSDYHNPPNAFLESIKERVASMTKSCHKIDP